MFRGLLAGLIALMMSGSVSAQSVSAEGSFSFNLFDSAGGTVSDIYTFDDAFGETHGKAVPAPFRLFVPRRDGVGLIADGRPDGGGFVKFTFYVETDDGGRAFLENIQVITASIPLYTDNADPAAARREAMTVIVRDLVYPSAVQGFQEPAILAIEPVSFGDDVPDAMQLVGRYVDPSIGEMLLRIAAVPHPNQTESYVTVSNIRWDWVPVDGPETMAQSMTGQVMDSWNYLDVE